MIPIFWRLLSKEASIAVALKSGWSRPSTILFPSDSPANEKAFNLSLMQVAEFGSDLTILCVYDSSDSAATELPISERSYGVLRGP
jgi:hypothetical protein